MKSKFNVIILIVLITGCTQKNISETQTPLTETPADSTVVDGATPATQDELKPSEEEKEPEPRFDGAYLVKFPFVSGYHCELDFSGNGRVTRASPVGGEETTGTWQLSDSSLQVAFSPDTATFTVRSFTEDELNLITTDEFGGSLAGVEDRDGYYYLRLYRLVFSSPYTADQVSGGWQAREGACSFEPGGAFSFGAADCDVKGTWTFEGNAIGVDLNEINCGWSDPFDNNLEVIRLSRGLMIVKNTPGAIEEFTR